jgi:hypothetical protein
MTWYTTSFGVSGPKAPGAVAAPDTIGRDRRQGQQGIIDKITYLKNMGVTAVWISAPYRNRDTEILDYQSGGGVNPWTSFHGYHVRNYFATNRHFGLMQYFAARRDALHTQGIKLIIDFVSNHTSRWQNPTNGSAAEDGRLYEPDKDGSGNYVFDANGNPVDHNSDGNLENLLANPHNDVNGWFHGFGDRDGDALRFGFRHKELGSLVATMGRAGNSVYLYGTGLGGTVTVKFDSTSAAVVSNSETMIEATVPGSVAGIRNITVVMGANTSNPFRYEVLSDDQVQVIFKVNASTVLGQNVHVVGNIPELGNWDPAKASEAMLNPNYPEWFLPVGVPKNTSFQFKFIKKDGSGSVTWEGGSNRSSTSPSSSTGTADTPVYTWQP